jgi:hypothetical protein
MARATKKSRYQPHPMLDMEQGVKARVEEETGRTWASWVETARKLGAKTTKELETRLKEDHGFGPRNASWLAFEATNGGGEDYGDPEALVDALYGGERSALRPLHEAVIDEALTLGDDVLVTACKTMVPLYRKHVFAELRPVEGGVEVELAIGDAAPKGRLLRAERRMPGDRITHRVLVKSMKDLNSEFFEWLSLAYGNGAGKMARSTEFEVPPAFAKALRANKPAATTWATMTPAMQRDMVEWVTSARQAETQAKRLATSIEKLSSGKKRIY